MKQRGAGAWRPALRQLDAGATTIERCDMLNLDDPRFRLNDLLTKYEAQAPREPASPPDEARQEAIVEAFDRLARHIIRPAMEEIGAELERRGQEYEILIAPGQQITMHLYPPVLRRSAYTTSWCPYVSFSRDASTAKVHIAQSTLMPNGQGCAEITDTLPIEQVTRQYVETQILDVLGNVLGAATG
jgi:hypothetical protein